MRRGLAWLAGLAVLLAVVVPALALLQPDRLEVERSIDIDAPAPEALRFVEDFTQWVKWSPWEHVDPNLKRLFGNPFRGMGASYTWSGNDAVGEARLKIRTARLPLGVFIDAGFQRPQRIDGRMAFKFDPLPTGARLTWSLSGPLSFGQRLAGTVLQGFAQLRPGQHAVFVPLAFQPDEQRAVGLGEVGERHPVFLLQGFQKCHVREQQAQRVVAAPRRRAAGQRRLRCQHAREHDTGALAA